MSDVHAERDLLNARRLAPWWRVVLPSRKNPECLRQGVDVCGSSVSMYGISHHFRGNVEPRPQGPFSIGNALLVRKIRQSEIPNDPLVVVEEEVLRLNIPVANPAVGQLVQRPCYTANCSN